MLVSHCSSSCASLYEMADKRKTVCRTMHKNSVLLYWNKKCCGHTEAVSCHFQTRWAPSFKTIHKVYNQCTNDGSVLEKKCCQPSSMRSPENTDAVRVALQRSPSKSTRKAAAQLGISRQSVQRILKSDWILSIQNDSVAWTFSPK
jgi:hypothetical protein